MASKEIMKKSLTDIAADAYLDVGNSRSSDLTNSPKDATKKMVKKLADKAQDEALILETQSYRSISNKEQALEARGRFKLYIGTYVKENGLDYPLLIELQKISNRKEIRLETKLSFWSHNLKSRFRKLLSKFTSIFKKNQELKSFISAHPEPVGGS